MKEKYLSELSDLAYEIRKAQDVPFGDLELISRIEDMLIKLSEEKTKIENVVAVIKEDNEFKKSLVKDLQFIEGSHKFLSDVLEIEKTKPAPSREFYTKTNDIVNDYSDESKNIEKDGRGKTGHFLGGFTVGLGVCALSAILALNGSCKNDKKQETSKVTSSVVSSATTPNVVDKPTLTPVPLTKEEQIIKDSKEIYESYINQEHLPEQFKKTMTPDLFENMIRMIRGEFMLENGNVVYNDMDFDTLGNFINSYYNSTSFTSLKNNLQYVEAQHMFEEGSIAKEVVKESDKLMKDIYESIKNDNPEEFKKLTTKWAEFIRDVFLHTEYSGNVIDIWSVESEYMYSVAQALYSPYGPSIIEYQDYHNIDICIPYCYDADGNLQEISLSSLWTEILYTPAQNYVAARAGKADEWAEVTDSVFLQTRNVTRAYFRSEYNKYMKEEVYPNLYGENDMQLKLK